MTPICQAFDPCNLTECTPDDRSALLTNVNVCEGDAGAGSPGDPLGTGPRAGSPPADVQQRAERLSRTEFGFVYHRSFDEPNAEQEILAPFQEGGPAPRPRRVPAGADFYLARLYEVPLLTREEEFHQFRKMNYLKFRADRLRRRLNPKTATLRQLADIERLQREALATRNGLVEANLRLVFSLAKRYATVGTAAFDDFISDGHMTLMRTIEKFDFARGVKFSTYATWSVINGFNALLKKESSVQRRHVSDQMEGVAESLTDHRVSKTMERSLEELQQSVGALLENLNARERRIIEARFGFGIDPPPTLKKVGERIGVSKERVRQLQERAVQKLRELAEEQHLELPYE